MEEDGGAAGSGMFSCGIAFERFSQWHACPFESSLGWVLFHRHDLSQAGIREDPIT